jgi:hypothetical protein
VICTAREALHSFGILPPPRADTRAIFDTAMGGDAQQYLMTWQKHRILTLAAFDALRFARTSMSHWLD